MNVKNIIKYLLDILLVIGFVLLFDKRALGMNLHEVIGLVIGGGILVHIMINFKWIINVSKLLFSKKISSRMKFGYILNFILLICVSLIILSGIFISKTILTNISSQNYIWRSIHISVSNITLILIGIHIGLHWSWISNITNKIFKVKIKKQVSIIITILILCFGSYKIYSEKFISNTLRIFNSQPLEHNKKERPNFSNSDEELNLEQLPGKNNQNKGNKPEISNKSIINVGINYLSICSVFIILTCYIDKYIKLKKKNHIVGGKNEEI